MASVWAGGRAGGGGDVIFFKFWLERNLKSSSFLRLEVDFL